MGSIKIFICQKSNVNYSDKLGKVLALANLKDTAAREELILQTIKCSADSTIRQLFGWKVSRIANPRFGNVRDRGIATQEEEDPASVIVTEAQELERGKTRAAMAISADIVPKCVPCTIQDSPCSDNPFADQACDECTYSDQKGKGRNER